MDVGTIVLICVLSVVAVLGITATVLSIKKGSCKKTFERTVAETNDETPVSEVADLIGNSKDVCALRLKDIVKVYGTGDNKVEALKGINLNFRKNEFVSILGPSGCGKTTLLNIIGGLDRYTSGDLIINGVSTKNFKDGDWDTYRNNSIGFVFQSYNLIPHQTVLSNVELALTLSGVSNKERKKRAKAVLKQVGLEGLENKLPNQMSGGQMQRVAIARALVNDPEIILADEPTGALDTQTSIQVMELLKNVAKDRLVIMVTHNPELAEKYSTRTINLLDGEKTGDTRPFDGKAKAEKKTEKGKAAMRLSTAFGLSLSNLKTKKGRTILTSVAGSIGIIGIALVLAVSNGFSNYIYKLQADTLSVYPLTVSEATIDLSDFNKLVNRTISDDVQAQKFKEYVYTREMFGDLTNMLKSNKITDEYISYVSEYADKENEKAAETSKKWSYCIKQGYGFDVNNYIYSDIGFLTDLFGDQKFTIPVDQVIKYLEKMFNTGMQSSNMNISAEFVRSYIPTVTEIPANQTLIESQYDKIYGDWATEEDELLVVVDRYNRISDITLALLGFRTIKNFDLTTFKVEFGGEEQISFADVVGKEFYYVKNDNRFVQNADGTFYDRTFLTGTTLGLDSPDLTLKVKGIVRLKEDVSEGVLDTGIAYTSKFVERVLTDNSGTSVIGEAIKASTEKKVTCYSWYENDPAMVTLINLMPTPMEKLMVRALSTSYSSGLRTVAGDNTVSKISIYSVDYQAKEDMKKYLDKWNDRYNGEADKDKQVHYSDSTAMLFSAMNSIVDAVEIVLICFTAISLVVSSIMIGIITYVSVVERTKEIGVLRSLGARKKDISRIFNAETFMIGLFAGLLGVIVTYILTIPINLIVGQFIANAGSLAALPVLSAGILVVISFVLTLIAGVIPSRIAAKKDPVVALRTE